MPVLKNEKIKGKFYSQIPCAWIEKLQNPSGANSFKVALYVWYMKGWKRECTDLPIALKSLNEHYNIDARALNRALHELENLGMISVKRNPGKSPLVTILCEEMYESYPTIQNGR